MQSLSAVLQDLEHTVIEKEPKSASLPIQPHGSTSDAGKTITAPMITQEQALAVAQPRNRAMTEVEAENLIHGLTQRLKQNLESGTWRTVEETLGGARLVLWRRTTIKVEGQELSTLIADCIEALKPPGNMTQRHLSVLAALKQTKSVDQRQANYLLQLMIGDLTEYPEVAVILGLRDLRRHDPSPFFPQIKAIMEAADPYRWQLRQAKTVLAIARGEGKGKSIEERVSDD